MFVRALLVIPTVSLLFACATFEEGTLGALGELTIKIDTDAKIDSARDKAMASYWDFMNSAPKDTLRVEALRRLADMELERSEESYVKAVDRLPQQQQVSLEERTAIKGASFEKAIALYEDAFEASKGDGTSGDEEVLYQLANAYEQTGQTKKALVALEQLFTDFPGISNRDEIHFRRGELFFKQGSYKEADLAYTQAMLVGVSSPYYEKALSQRGWTAYKQTQYEKALYSFFTLADRKLRDQSGNVTGESSQLSRGDKELMNDVFRAVYLSFNELGGAEAIQAYFSKRGHKSYESRIYKGLGDYYLDKSRFQDAADVYKAFINQYADHALAPEFDLYSIEAYTAGGFASLIIQEKERFTQHYRISGEYWNKHPKSVRDKLIPLLEKNTEEIANHFHATAQKTHKPEDYQRAYLWYKRYLQRYPESKKAQAINLALADALFENKLYESSTKEYEKTAYQYANNGNLNTKAGYAALVAYDKHSRQLEGKPKEIWDRLAVGGALRFGKAFPQDKRAPTVLTKAAEDLFALKKYSQAAVAAQNILDLKVETSNEMKRTAWLIIAQAEFEKQRYTEAEDAYKVALTLVGDDAALKTHITTGIAATVYKSGELLVKSGNTQAAIEKFQQVAVIAPESDMSVTAKFDIAAAYMKEKQWESAIQNFTDFRRDYPSSPLQKNVTENLAVAYVESKQSLLAAQEFKRIIAENKEITSKRDLTWRLAELYEEVDATQQVIETYENYIKEYPTPLGQTIEARQKLAVISKTQGNDIRYHYWLMEIVKADKNGGSERSDRSQYLAAKATLELAEPRLKSFKDVQLVAPLKKNLDMKKERMQEAVDAYTAAAEYGVAEVSTASFYWLGEIYGGFGQELMESERPNGLSVTEREQYDILLEEQAYPFEEKSIDIHESNANRAKDGTYDEWVKKSFAALSMLRPARYGKAERSEVFADITN